MKSPRLKPVIQELIQEHKEKWQRYEDYKKNRVLSM